LLPNKTVQVLRLWKRFHKRNNWLFSATPQGAQASAVLYSLVVTARENG
jgi:hypothetical protein